MSAAFLGTVLLYFTSGYPMVMQVTMCLPSGTPAISLISGFTATALTKKPLKKVPRPSALAMSSMFEDASDAFTSENAVVVGNDSGALHGF